MRQTGGRGQYGVVALEVEPLRARRTGFEFVNKIVGGAVPREYIGPIEQGVRGALESGVLAGYPVIDVRCTLLDGDYHQVDSSEMAFKMAGIDGIRRGDGEGEPGAAGAGHEGWRSARRRSSSATCWATSTRGAGRSRSTTSAATCKVIRALVPLAETFGYATDLRSLTQGRASYSMEFDHYEEVPRGVAEKILGTRSKRAVRAGV